MGESYPLATSVFFYSVQTQKSKFFHIEKIFL